MANILKEIEDAGRSTDNVVGHLTVGEIVIPVQLAEIPEVKDALEEIFIAYDVDLKEFTVGNKANKINPDTGYPEFFFNKIIKVVSGGGKAVQNVVNRVTGKSEDKKKKSSSSESKNNNPSNNYQQTYNQNSKAFDDAIAAMQKKDADEKARADQEAKDKAIAAESARARGMAAENQAQIAGQLSNTLSTPIQSNATTAQTGYTPSGFSAEKPTKTVPGSVGGAVPTDTASAMPAALIAQKINQDSGGTNQQQNRFNIPKTEGLVFGGT